MAGISGYQVAEPYHFNVAILNPGGHFKPNDGSYVVPYRGLYSFTIAIEAHDDVRPKFYLQVDGDEVAYMKNYDDGTEKDNSLIMTRNLYLNAGQVITIDASNIDGVQGESGWGEPAYYSWFQGHLIYVDE